MISIIRICHQAIHSRAMIGPIAVLTPAPMVARHYESCLSAILAHALRRSPKLLDKSALICLQIFQHPFHGERLKGKSRIALTNLYQKCQAPFQITHAPSRRLVNACAVMASPSRFFQHTSPW